MGGRKRFNPAVRNAKTFRKKAIKVGRTLRHDNATDTRVCAKKIAIVEQLRGEGDDVPDSSTDAVVHRHPQKGLDELVAQLGHYNENICRDAIHGVRLQLKDSSEQLRRHLRKIIPAIGSLINRELKSTATRNQLKRLIEMVCAVPSEVISSHFGLFCGYVLTGISDVRAPIRTLSFDVLTLLLQKYGRLCSQNRELFSAFLQLMDGQRKPENRTKLLDALSQFIVVFGVFNDNKLWPERTLTISFEKEVTETRSSAPAVSLLPSAAYFHFPVLCLDSATSADGTSPLMTRDGLLNCCRVFCPLLEAIIQVEKDADGTKFTSTMSRCFALLCFSFVGNAIVSFCVGSTTSSLGLSMSLCTFWTSNLTGRANYAAKSLQCLANYVDVR